MSEKKTDPFTHEPLPYVVRLRVVLSQDSIPEIREYKIVAYSIMEAMLSALFQAGGTEIDGVKYAVEDIQPDIPEYFSMIIKRLI